MNNILLVAGREFRQIAAMRSFWLTLLIIPVALALGPLLAKMFDDDESSRIVIIDRSGGDTGAALKARFDEDEERLVLNRLSRYVRRHSLESADPEAPWAQHDRYYTSADITAFRDAGGVESALAKIGPVKDPATPDFDPPNRTYDVVAAPADLARAEGEDLQRRVDAMLDADDDLPADQRANLVVRIGENYPADPTVRLWSNDEPGTRFTALLREVLTNDLRTRLMAQGGISAQNAAAIAAAQPQLAVTTPPPGGGARTALLVRSAIPLALAYVLMMGLMLSGSWMLQSSVEERSNKLLESLLACVTPEELMYGKLAGTLAVGLSMILFWVACAGVATYAGQGYVADLIRPALEPLNSPWMILAIIYFFVAGYVAVSILFLAIGAMSESMRDAQGYMMPVLFAVLIPTTILMQSIVAGQDGPAVQLLTWIPLWTPFAVLARLGLGIETWELIGSGIVLALFVYAEFVLLGRLFRRSLLAQGQKPTLSLLWNRMRAGND